MNVAEKKRSRKLAWFLILTLMGFGISVGGGMLGGVLATLIPLNLERVAGLHPAVEDRAGRIFSAGVCGLNQVRTGSGCAEVVVTSVREEEVLFPSRLKDKGVVELFGTLSIPEGVEGKRPALVIVHGSGPNLREGRVPGDLLAKYDQSFELYRFMANEFAQQGFVVLRYDKRTSAPYRSQIVPETFSFTDFMTDAQDALDFLAQHPRVQDNALVVLGHSQGGQLAPHIVADDPRVAATILMGGSTQTFGALVLEQLHRYGELRKQRFDYLSQWLVALEAAPYRECFEPIMANDFDPSDSCLGIPMREWAAYEALAQKTGDVMTQLHCPLMAIQGSMDINIDPLEIPRMQEIMKGKDAEFHYVYGLDHSLVSHFDRPSPIVVDEEALRRFRQFFASVPFPALPEAKPPKETSPLETVRP
jgi:hypothetical protein